MKNPLLTFVESACIQTLLEMSKANSLIILFLLSISAPFCVCGQNVTVLHSFTNTPDGARPYIGGEMVLAGNILLGTTSQGGSSNDGTIFSINSDGTSYAILHNFTGGADGSTPPAGLLQCSNLLYGTTLSGGTNGSGIVFSQSIAGTNFTVLHAFAATAVHGLVIEPQTVITNVDGACPYGELLLLSNRLYGTTSLGGSNASGTVFSLNTDGTDFKILHTFAANGYAVNSLFPSGTNADGFYSTAGLVSQDGCLYGSATAGSTNGHGVVFSMSPDGSNFTLLHAFSKFSLPVFRNTDGISPSGLVLSGNMLFGTTAGAGSNSAGTIFSLNTNGSSFTVLHSFNSGDGTPSLAGLLALGDKLYGTTSQNGPNGSGTIFSLNDDGTGFAVLYGFPAEASNGTNATGAYTTSGLTLLNDVLYTTPQQGSVQGIGAIIALQLPLAFTGIIFNSDGTVTLGLVGTPYLTYGVEATTDLLSPISWHNIGTNTANADGSWQFTDYGATNYQGQFYRSTLISQ